MPLTQIEKQQILDAVAAALVANVESAPAVAWFRDTSGTPKACDPSDVEQVKINAAHGQRANLTRGVAAKDFPAYLNLCDKIVAATSPQEADTVILGAGSFPPDVAVLLVLGGGAQGFGPFQSPSIFAPWGSGFDMAGAAAWLVAQPGFAGPGGN